MSTPDLTVELYPPPGWGPIEQEPDDEGTVLLALAPTDWAADLGVRPNLVIGLGPESEESIGAVATQTAATLIALEQGHRLVSWDLWRDEGGRRLLSTWPSGDALICTTTWMRVEEGRPLSVTATVDADRYLRVMPFIGAAVDGLRVRPTREEDGRG